MAARPSSWRRRFFGSLLSALCLYIVSATVYFFHTFGSQLEGFAHSSFLENYEYSPLDDLIRQTKAPSLRTLLTLLKDHAPTGAYDEPIQDMEAEHTRCRRYGFDYYTNVTERRRTRRRVFWGGLIADDSWHTIAAHAAETYGLYHTVAFVESNTTLKMTQRDLRFPPHSLHRNVLHSGIFGPNSKVTVDLYVDGPEALVDTSQTRLLREQLQRELILQRWKRNGMTIHDIGIVSDLDEVVSRDFLLAAMTCDIPEFRLGQDCRMPKVITRTMTFESSPECVVDKKFWHHPDMIIGECVDMIGDSNIHKPGQRQHKNGTLGYRVKGYGTDGNDYAMMPNTTMFPLWKPVDFRSTKGTQLMGQDKALGAYGYTGYHFHNFFDSIEDLRGKYATSYGHANPSASRMPLGKIQEDLNIAINCATERPDVPYKKKLTSKKRVMGGFGAIAGLRPLLFEHSEYRIARQEELRELFLEDESKFGQFIYIVKEKKG
jgi:hypothetical protein